MAEQMTIEQPAVTPEQAPETTPETPAEVTPEAVPSEKPAEEAAPVVQETPEERQTRYQKRINQLVRERTEAQRETERLRQQMQATTEEKPVIQTQEPQAEDFSTTEEYVKAVAKWEVKQERAAAAQEDVRRRQEETFRESVTRFEPLVDKAREKYADFDEVTSADLYTPQTQQLLYDSPQGAEIAYYLGTHPGEADKLNRMTPMVAMRAILSLEQKMATQKKTVSSAPAPITPVGGGSGGPTTDPEKMTTAEWMEWDKQQQLDRLKRSPI